jgi:hypothetical protein
MMNVSFIFRARIKCVGFLILLFFLAGERVSVAQPGADSTYRQLQQAFQQPPEQARPWVFWYWMHAAVSREGITTDLEAMKANGIGGAYLMPIKDTTSPPLIQPVVQQLSPVWFDMVRHAMEEANRLELKLGMHVSDGFALAGGPWIKPEMSMQKVVGSQIQVMGGIMIDTLLPLPAIKEKFYRDIRVYAWKSLPGEDVNSYTVPPVVTNSMGEDVSFLAIKGNTKTFGTNDECWIQYGFKEPFTCRSLRILATGQTYQSQRMIIMVSHDGVNFTRHTRLQTPRHGWQDGDEPYTHAIVPVTAKYFRLVYSKDGTEPGAEDLDAAKWKPSIKITGIELSSAPRLHQYEGKSGAVWRISPQASSIQLPNDLVIPQNGLIDLTEFLQPDGRLKWLAPAGNYTILRMGHTSTGHTNYTGGKGLGLECDKFSKDAVKMQFDNWFGRVYSEVGDSLAKKVLKVFHIDSWECGSQNWSAGFPDEFRSRRGYDLLPYLPVMLGIPVESAAKSEMILKDVRETIAELVHDVFYETLTPLAHSLGCQVSAESVAPTMVSDGMRHYDAVDLPMGEFWLNSPTHDKPNDMLDAISGAHVYGKKIIQAEAFTSVRMNWKEHPGMLKTLGDLNLAAGVNKLVFHVFAHNPIPANKPGVTLDGVGLFFQPNQTWWKASKAWMDYITRCQALLQMGEPVTDIAVFTGEDAPRRALLPELLVPVLPGLYGDSLVAAERIRLANTGQPLRSKPDGVNASANIADPVMLMHAMRGYRYDSFNKDALLRLAKAKDGVILTQGQPGYKVLVAPGVHRMDPGGNDLSGEVKRKLNEFTVQGVPLVNNTSNSVLSHSASIHNGPWIKPDFFSLGIAPDFLAEENGKPAGAIAWNHRKLNNADIYFISNQQEHQRLVLVSFRVSGKIPEIWNPVTGKTKDILPWDTSGSRTTFELPLVEGEAQFVIFSRSGVPLPAPVRHINFPVVDTLNISDDWKIKFDTAFGGPVNLLQTPHLSSWTQSSNDSIKYYSGTAIYTNRFKVGRKELKAKSVYLVIDSLYNIADITINKKLCGTLWTSPFHLDISAALKRGDNTVEIAVSNTWHNRLIGDQLLPANQRRTWTTAPFRLKGKNLEPAGIGGKVKLQFMIK